MRQKVMIGFSTAQQSTNYIPFKVLQIDFFVCLETGTAKRSGWTDGIAKLLGIKEDESDSGQLYLFPIYDVDTNTKKPKNESKDKKVHELAEWIKQLIDIRFRDEEVYFNFGGGQKNHALALWECFRMRYDDHKRSDIAVYTDPSNNVIEQYYYNEAGKLTAKADLPLRLRNTSLNDIIRLYGYEVSEQKPWHKLFRAAMKVNGKLTETVLPSPLLNPLQAALIQNPLIREYNFGIQAARAAANKKDINEKERYKYADTRLTIFKKFRDDSELLNQLMAIYNTSISTILSLIDDDHLFSLLTDFDEPRKNDTLKKRIQYSTYVERVLAYQFRKYIQSEEESTELNVIEGYSNITIINPRKKVKENNEIGEYDLLLVTDQARLIALDAKTFSFNGKDFDARIHNLKAIAGQYIQFYVVIPFFCEDMSKDWWKDELNSTFRKLPSKLTQMEVKFYVITDSKTSFYINEEGDKWAANKTNKISIQMTPIQFFFENELKHK